MSLEDQLKDVVLPEFFTGTKLKDGNIIPVHMFQYVIGSMTKDATSPKVIITAEMEVINYTLEEFIVVFNKCVRESNLLIRNVNNDRRDQTS